MRPKLWCLLPFWLLVSFLFHTQAYGDFSAIRIATATHNSVLRPMSQGVYDLFSDKSFFCFMQENSNPYVAMCDHSNGLHTWGTPQRVHTQASASKYNYPTMDMLPDRRLVMTYASPFDEALGFAVSNAPADASAWTVSNVDIGRVRHVEYPRIKVDRRGCIYLFYIHKPDSNAAHKRWYYYVKSEDSGTTWSDPVLCLQRELDDPYGMCEMYVGYTTQEPMQDNEPERWWFAFTASSGFQYQGTHRGSMNSGFLYDHTADWGSGSNFTYRWLYNVTKGTHSGIDSADDTHVFPSSPMDWDTGDAYGIAYHNIYHSDIFVVYFRPDTGRWYDAAHTDLGEVVSRAEMETDAARPYQSPVPPAAKDVGYIPVVAVNDQGHPSTVHNDTIYNWDGTRWNTVSGTRPSGDLRFFWFADGQYYWAAGRLEVFASPDTQIWNRIGSTSLPDANGYPAYATFISQGHAQAAMNVHEYRQDQAGNAYALAFAQSTSAKTIVLRTPHPHIPAGGRAIIHAYVTDKYHGTRSRIRDAANEITLSVVEGRARVNPGAVHAVNGHAQFTVDHFGFQTGPIVCEAMSSGLEPSRITLDISGASGTPLNVTLPGTILLLNE